MRATTMKDADGYPEYPTGLGWPGMGDTTGRLLTGLGWPRVDPGAPVPITAASGRAGTDSRRTP